MGAFAHVCALFAVVVSLLTGVGFWCIAGTVMIGPFIKNFSIQFITGVWFWCVWPAFIAGSAVAGVVLINRANEWFERVTS